MDPVYHISHYDIDEVCGWSSYIVPLESVAINDSLTYEEYESKFTIWETMKLL